MNEIRNDLKSNHGMTIVELMVVIVVIGILAGIASPSIFRAIERANSLGVARDVANAMRTGRNQAMSRGEPVWVAFDTGTTSSDRGRVVLLRQTGNAVVSGSGDVLCPTGSECGAGQLCKCPAADPQCDDGARICWENIPRSCRELATTNWAIVGDLDINLRSGDAALHGVDPAEGCATGNGVTGCATMICFEPDGRALTWNGRNLSQVASANRCLGEDFIVWTGDSDETIGAAEIGCAANAAARRQQREDRDLKQVYRIVVPFNGAISVSQ